MSLIERVLPLNFIRNFPGDRNRLVDLDFIHED
jgi:hypothetical protein